MVVTREKSAIETIECEEEYKPEPDMYVGETRVEDEGQDGAQKVTKKIVSENGKTVDENVVEVETIREPSNRVVLTGTRNYDGFGGSSDAVDAGVSYKDDATYTTLAIPVEEVHVTSRFGPRWGGFHHGLDVGAPMGSDIYAADSGTVYHAAVSYTHLDVYKRQAMAHNLGWLHSRIQNDKLDLHLYELKPKAEKAA